MTRSQQQYLQDILEAMEHAEQFVEGMTFEELEGDLRTQYALQRAFEIIGEATKQLDPEVREAYSEVPWKKMAGMRDVLIHGYFAVRLEVVWNTVHERFARIKPQLRQILNELSESSGSSEQGN